MRRYLPVLFLVLLAACSVLPSPANPTPFPKPGSGAPVIGGTPVILPTPARTALQEEIPIDSVDIQELMLTSHANWQSLWADGEIVYYAPDGSENPVQTIRVQIWIEQPGKTRVLTGDAGGAPVQQTASDGAYMKGPENFIQPIPDFILQPFNPPSVTSDTIYPHPSTSLLNTPLGDLVFPTALAQRGGEYTITGTESTIGREAFSVEWRREPGGAVVDRFLVDSQTGVLLLQQNYGKPGGASLNYQLFIDQLSINHLFPETTFSLGLPLPGSFASGPFDLMNNQP